MLATALLALAGSAAASPLDLAKRGPERSLGWKLQTTFQGENWYSTWNFETFDDPTRGKTNYVNLDEARSKNLTWVDDQGRFGMKADSWSKPSRDSGRGRDSVRIQSNERFFDSLLVLDLVHIPTGCGTWPAFWTIGTGEWPQGGEIDIIEGTNDQGNNQYTVHTTTGCKIPKKNNDDLSGNNEPFTGEARALDCSPVAGCSIDGQDPDGTTFGPGLNKVGGGFLVTRIKQSHGISMWWFPRSKGIPDVLTQGKDTVDEKELGMRIAHFPASEQCDLDKSLTEQQLIFNLAMCGGWCASRYQGAGQCQAKYPGKSWEDVVYDHPEEFSEAYWLINSLKVFGFCEECGSGPDAPAPASSSSASPSPSQSSSESPPPTPTPDSSSQSPSPSPTPESSSESTSPSPTPESSSESPSPSPTPESSSESPSPSPSPETTEESTTDAAPTQTLTAGETVTIDGQPWTSTWSSAWTSTWHSAWTSAWTSTYTVPASLPTNFNGGIYMPGEGPNDAGAGGEGGNGAQGQCLGQHQMPSDRDWDDAYEQWAEEYQWHYHSQGNRRWKHRVHRGNESGASHAGAESEPKLDAAAETSGETEQPAEHAEPVKRAQRHGRRSWASGSRRH